MRIFIAGHRGMAGSAIRRHLEAHGGHELIVRTRDELDLTDQRAVAGFLESERPDQVYLAAAKVGGIHANDTLPAEFIHQNLTIQGNVIHGAFAAGVRQLLFLGSSCIYPKHAPQPMPEACLLDGHLEPTNEPYAIAKIAGIKMCEAYNRQYGTDYRSLMPTNLYGPGDNYHPQNSHVLPALVRKFVEAQAAGAASVTLWGSGEPRREFLHVDDLAAAAVYFCNLDAERWGARSFVNIGTGVDLRILDLARAIAAEVGFEGEIELNRSMPDGTPRKLLDVSVATSLGWTSSISLEEGLRRTVAEFSEATRL